MLAISHPMLVPRGPPVGWDSCVTTSPLCKGLMAGTCLLKQWSTATPVCAVYRPEAA